MQAREHHVPCAQSGGTQRHPCSSHGSGVAEAEGESSSKGFWAVIHAKNGVEMAVMMDPACFVC